MILDLKDLKPGEKQYFLQHVIAPRPVCFASTISAAGEVNLSPFSFFNLFSSNPPIVIFSPSRRVRDNTTKHTLQNVEEVPEVVINIVTYDMVQQVSLASCEYPKGVSEFVKAGFTEEKATLVKPPMVKESKVKLECRVQEIKKLGEEGGAENLVINHIARLGADWYCVVDETNLFQVEKPNVHLGIGFDALPESVRRSPILSGNDLAMLANVTELPVIDPSFDDAHLKQIIQYYSLNPAELETELHRHAKKLLEKKEVSAAWQVLLSHSG